MVKTETEALPPDWPEGAFVKEEETPPAWPEGAIVKEEIKEEPPMWPEGAVVKQEQQELARAGPQDGATPMQQCGGHGCELARFHEGLCTSNSLAKATQQKRAAPPSEDSDGVEIESEKDEEAGVAEEGQNGATPTGQRVGTVAKASEHAGVVAGGGHGHPRHAHRAGAQLEQDRAVAAGAERVLSQEPLAEDRKGPEAARGGRPVQKSLPRLWSPEAWARVPSKARWQAKHGEGATDRDNHRPFGSEHAGSLHALIPLAHPAHPTHHQPRQHHPLPLCPSALTDARRRTVHSLHSHSLHCRTRFAGGGSAGRTTPA